MARGKRPSANRPIGPAAAVMAAMEAEGVDLDDPDEINAWMDAFNARTFEERAAVLTDDLFSDDDDDFLDDLPTAYIELPAEDDARASASQSMLLAQARLLVGFIGDGRKLTQTGNLTLADARYLVTLLDTGDLVDEVIGDRTFKTKSAADLLELTFIVRIATAARFVRKLHGKLVATKAGRNLGRQTLADLQRLVEAIDDAGLVSGRTKDSQFIWSALAPFFDDLFVPLTTLLLVSPEGVDVDEIVEQAFADFEAEVELRNEFFNEARRREFVENEIGHALRTLEAAGVAAWTDATETTSYGYTKRRGGMLTATRAGRWVLFHYLTKRYDVPLRVAGPARFIGLDFEALIRACEASADQDFDEVMREIDAWIDYRGGEAMSEITAAVRASADPAVRSLALAVLAERFGADAEPHVRSLVDSPTTRGAALLWLVDLELEPAEVLLDPDPSVFVDVLALTLVHHGPQGMVDVFEHVGDHDAQIALLQQLWRQSNPATATVLATLGRHHPYNRVAKAARKAVMQHATHEANRRR